MEGRNKSIKKFYWQLWFGNDEEAQDLNVCDTFTGRKVTISVNNVEAFCAVVGNLQEKFKTLMISIILTRYVSFHFTAHLETSDISYSW